MALVATVVPATYQKGIQPRVAASDCKITINNVELDEKRTTSGEIVLTAYLKIENTQNIDVVLSRLSLDVYHYSAQVDRNRWIGTFNTTAEYTIPANGYISSYFDTSYRIQDSILDSDTTSHGIEYYITGDPDVKRVQATLTLSQDVSQGSGTTEAIASLIENGYLEIKLKGKAKVGPFEFDYTATETITENLWDSKLVITDVFNYHRSPETDEFPIYDATINNSDTNVYVVVAKMHNPSTLPIVLMNYDLDLLDPEDNVIATGMAVEELSSYVYDPDYQKSGSRKTVSKIFMDGKTSISLPAINKVSELEDEWKNIVLLFNFTDTNPQYSYAPQSKDSSTKVNTMWFLENLFNNPTFCGNGYKLQGAAKVVIGSLSTGPSGYNGIAIDVGGPNQKTHFTIKNVEFSQFPLTEGYTDNDYSTYFDISKQTPKPISLKEKLTVGQMNVTHINVDNNATKVRLTLNSSLTFENPYRVSFNVTHLQTSYYRVGPTSSETTTYGFGEGITGAVNLDINRAKVMNPSKSPDDNNNSYTFSVKMNSSLTKIPHEIQLEYNTSDYSQEGITKIFEDIGIDPLTLNLTDPLWLLGPSAMGGKHDYDTTTIIEYLIKNEIDPLMLLRSLNTSIVHYYGDNAYYPLRGSFFGTRPKEYDGYQLYSDGGAKSAEQLWRDTYIQSNDFPVNLYNQGQKYYIPAELTTDGWYQSYSEIGQYVQYEIVRNNLNIPNNWLWPGDDDVGPRDLRGLITNNLDSSEVLTLGGQTHWIPGNDDIIWRVYTTSDSDFWGYAYDHENHLRNWYMVRGANSEPLMFRQNFTIDSNRIHSVDEIENATLSISYRYPSGMASDLGRFGIGWWNPDKSEYNYSRYDKDETYDIYQSKGLYGYPCYDSAQSTETLQDWKVESVDVSQYIKDAYAKYENTSNPAYLQMEVAFGANGNGYAYFDDFVLEIDYKNEVDKPFRLKDFFKYIEDEDVVQGNAFKLLEDINFDPVKLMSFIQSDLGINPDPSGEGANMTNYFKSTDTEISRIITLMEELEKINSIGAGEPLSFLDMLNYTRYTIDQNPTNNVDTPYGPRTVVHNEGYVIEDPYAASKAIIDALGDDMFVDEYGNKKSYANNLHGKELWVMLENLELYLPWVVVYLFMHGWTKDDMFDMFEALGLMKEVKTNYWGDQVYVQSHGEIRESILLSEDIELNMLIGIHLNLLDDFPMNFTATMTDPIEDPFLKFYQYVNSGSGGGTRSVIHTTGDIMPPTIITLNTPFTGQGSVLGGLITFGIDGTVTNELVLEDYEVKIWIDGNPGSRIAPPWPGSENPYLSQTDDGFNDAGTGLVTHFLRQTINFNDAPFLELNGDVIGLFQFLDDYFFLSSQYSDGSSVYTNDYSSYTLLNYFDMSSKDFIDVITGYDQFSGTFDPNGNGKADDWTAPMGSIADGGYNWLDRDLVPRENTWALRAWGKNVFDDRLYWNTGETELNGKIMWSDSHQFLDDGFDGEVDTSVHHFESGAPPIVSLIDMLTWLSKVTGSVDSGDIFNWLEGRMTFDKYIIQNPSLYGDIVHWDSYDRGMGLQKVWAMLDNATFNATGLFNWFQNVKGAKPYGLMYELNTWDTVPGTDSPNAQDMFYYIQNPNYVLQPDGGVSFIFHNGIGGSGQTDNTVAKDNFWNLFNGSWWSQNGGESKYWDTSSPWDTLPGLIFDRLIELEKEQIALGKEGSNVTYNYFQMMINLGVIPEDWVDSIENQGILPLELIAVYDSLNFTKLFREARENDKKTRIKINGTFRIVVYNLPLYDVNHKGNTLNYTINPTEYDVKTYMPNFIDPYRYSSINGTYTNNI
jgi:hypothetical protein